MKVASARAGKPLQYRGITVSGLGQLWHLISVTWLVTWLVSLQTVQSATIEYQSSQSRITVPGPLTQQSLVAGGWGLLVPATPTDDQFIVLKTLPSK